MNKKQEILENVINICVECCNTNIPNYGNIITREMVLSKERIGEVADWTRCIIVNQLYAMGFTTELIANVLNRKPQSIIDKRNKFNELVVSSFAFRIASAEVVLKCRDLMRQCLLEMDME